jgi:hypothetical protein
LTKRKKEKKKKRKKRKRKEKKRKRVGKKQRKGKERKREKKVLKKPWHTFLAVPFRIVPLIMLLGENPTKHKKRKTNLKEETG